jgi:hypothetical protein
MGDNGCGGICPSLVFLTDCFTTVAHWFVCWLPYNQLYCTAVCFTHNSEYQKGCTVPVCRTKGHILHRST